MDWPKYPMNHIGIRYALKSNDGYMYEERRNLEWVEKSNKSSSTKHVIEFLKECITCDEFLNEDSDDREDHYDKKFLT